MARVNSAFRMTLILVLSTMIQARGQDAAPAATTGHVPINDLGTGLYLNQFQGGLYPNGSNQVPPAHILAGLTKAAAILPRDAAGNPSPSGKYVLLSVGMSNTTQEFGGSGAFISQATANPIVNHTTLALVDGAAGGQTAGTWDAPSDANYNRVRDLLAPKGLTEAQVQAAWVKVADAQPSMSLPNTSADAFTLQRQMGDIVRACKSRYPNLQVVFLSSRIYAGYATTLLNPEPYAYESGFAVKWLIEAQINQVATGQIDSLAGDLDYRSNKAPWLAWGPYLWADGTTPRTDGLVWLQTDLATDGTHPSTTGRQKVGAMLLSFLLTSPFSRTWFGSYTPGDINADGKVNVFDLQILAASWGESASQPGYDLRADLTGDNKVNVFDLQILAANWNK